MSARASTYTQPGPPRAPLPDLQLADEPTVKGRKQVSAFAAAFSAVLSRWGLVDACRELNKVRRKPGDKIDPAEVRGLCLVMLDASQRVEWRAEQQAGADPAYPARRRFRASVATLEMFYRREQMPPELREDADGRQKFFDSRARAFRRRWRKLEAVQRFLHVALFEREDGDATGRAKIAPAFTDHLADLIVQTARRAAEFKGEPINRYNRAADEALKAFRASVPVYAPEWKMPAADEGTDADEETPPRETDPRKALRAFGARFVSDARARFAALRAAGMSEQDEQEAREELIGQILSGLAEVGDAPPGGGGARVISNADTEAAPRTSARVSARTNLSAFHTRDPLDLAGNSQNAADEEGGISARPGAASLADAEAFAALAASVGAERVTVTLLDDTRREGQEGYLVEAATLKLARFQDRLPYYLGRSERERLSLSVRLRSKKKSFGLHFMQIDDATPEQVARLAPFAFAVVKTSRDGLPQAWLAFADALTLEAHAAVRRRLMRGLNPDGDAGQANSGAGGALRWPGSLNCKPNRRLEDGTPPRVELQAGTLGRTVTLAELETADLLAPPEPEPLPVAPRPNVLAFTPRGAARQWPDLNTYLDRHRKTDGTADRSRAEYAWCCAAIRAGFEEWEIESELSAITLKGQGRRDGYIRETVAAAARRCAYSSPGVERRERVAI